MKYICVRTYGNGKYMNKVLNIYFNWLSQAERVCDKLNQKDNINGNEDKWIALPINEYIGEVWE